MEPFCYLLEKNGLTRSIEAVDDDILIVDVAWSISQVRLNIEPEQFRLEDTRQHRIQVLRTSSTLEAQCRVKLATAWPTHIRLPTINNCFSMKLLFWNCRGAGNQNFKNSMKDLYRDHKPDVAVFLETKVPFQSLGNYFDRFGLTDSITVDPDGKIGGIWMLWNPATISLKPFHTSNQCIHAMVTKNNFEEWILTAVYASPNHRLRDKLWSNLAVMADFYNVPWLVAGDFNDHIDTSEKKSYTGTSNSHMNLRSQLFAANINRCKLIDLGCNGPRLTWTNNRGGMANTLVRLDRALANEGWRIKFPEASVSNIPRTYSDHCPILVNTEGRIKINSDGSSSKSIGYGSFGGLARNEEGRWLEGFCGFIGGAEVLRAELWGIKHALNLAKERRWNGVDVESDSLLAVNLINDMGEVNHHPERALIADCRLLKEETGAKLCHILREANKCADILAKIGGAQRELHMRILIPPDEVVEQLMADLVGVSYPRGS